MPTIKQNYNSTEIPDDVSSFTPTPKNYITNPSMAISQENGDGPNTAAVTELFGADEWNTTNDTGTGTIDVERGTLSGFRSYKVTATSAVTDLSGTLDAGRIQQRFEGVNVFGLNGKTITLAFIARTNWDGLLPISFLGKNDTRSYVTSVPVVSGISNVTVTLDLESDTIFDNSNDSEFRVFIGLCNEGTQSTGNENVWQSGVFLSSNLATQWVKTANNYVEITAVQLVEGDTAPAFQPNTYGQDLADCQRYWQKSYNQADLPGTITLSGQYSFLSSSTIVREGFRFSPMRTIPSVTLYSPATGASGFFSGGTDGDVADTPSQVGENGAVISASTTTAVQSITYHFVANARL